MTSPEVRALVYEAMAGMFEAGRENERSRPGKAWYETAPVHTASDALIAAIHAAGWAVVPREATERQYEEMKIMAEAMLSVAATAPVEFDALYSFHR